MMIRYTHVRVDPRRMISGILRSPGYTQTLKQSARICFHLGVADGEPPSTSCVTASHALGPSHAVPAQKCPSCKMYVGLPFHLTLTSNILTACFTFPAVSKALNGN